MRKFSLEELKQKYIGQKNINGKITVIDVYRSGPKQEIYLKYQCVCGNISQTDIYRFKTVKSCGCSSTALEDPNAAPFNAAYISYRIGAERRNLSFNITKEEFRYITQQNCVYCGAVPQMLRTSQHGGRYLYNGIDRLDNNQGYILENCAPCCTRCNYLKSNLDQDKFIETIMTIIQKNTLTIGIPIHKLDSYFARVHTISQNSHDAETKVGAILIDPKSGAVKAEGFNGFVRGAPDNQLPNTRPDKYIYMIHAEMNLLCNAVRSGICTDKCVVVCTLSPCKNCVRSLYQAGINTIYFKDKYGDLNDSIDMGDLTIIVEPIDKYFKMILKPSI